MSKGLSNFQIDDFFKDEENEELKNYMSTYSIDSITKYINFYEIIKRRNAKYPFAIFNTGKKNEPGVHWWSFLDIDPKNSLFLFDSFGLEGFKLFIVNNDQQIINQLLYNFSKCKVKINQKLSLCSMKFCIETWEKNRTKNKKSTNRYCTKLFSFIRTVCKIKKKALYEHINTRKQCAKLDKFKL